MFKYLAGIWFAILPFFKREAEKVLDQDGDGDFDAADVIKILVKMTAKLREEGLPQSAAKLSDVAACMVKECGQAKPAPATLGLGGQILAGVRAAVAADEARDRALAQPLPDTAIEHVAGNIAPPT